MKKRILVCTALSKFLRLNRYAISLAGPAVIINYIDDEKFDIDYIDFDAKAIAEHKSVYDLFKYRTLSSLLDEYIDIINSGDYAYVLCSVQELQPKSFNNNVLIILKYIFDSVKTEYHIGGTGVASQTDFSDPGLYPDLIDLFPEYTEFYNEMTWPLEFKFKTDKIFTQFISDDTWSKFNKLIDPSHQTPLDTARSYNSFGSVVKTHRGYLYPKIASILKYDIDNQVDLRYSYKSILENHGHASPLMSTSADDYVLQAMLEFSFGCPNDCNFCPSGGSRPFQQLKVQEMKDIMSSYIDRGYNAFFFLDNSSNAWPDEFYNWIVRSNHKIQWSASFNARKTDPDFWKMVFDAGGRMASIGFETIDDRMLKFINKKTTSMELQDGLDDAHNAGLMVTTNFIIGFPSEDNESVKKMIEFIRRNHNKINHIAINAFRLITASSFHVNPSKYGLKLDEYSDIPFDECSMPSDLNIPYTEIDGRFSDFSFAELTNYKNRLIELIKGVIPQSIVHVTSTDFDQHLIFALFGIFKTKNKVVDWINTYKN